MNLWLYFKPTQKQYKELFYLTLDIKNAIYKELTNYLSVILEELLLEKNQKTNVIDDLVNSQSQIENMKKCCFCQVSDINNKKQVCSNCCNKLPTISKINQQFIEQSNIKNITDKPLVVCPYRDFAYCQGYQTENQLQFFKKCSDHYKL
ncbi:9147_t:CDS:2 [Cetraspora pellucida]|uniref:9147_t:CDS:1 n=1 Tax=Cetraspora pellucida TaxID=1433469 RepID=A0ACA9LK31_9GLOM|nr:9147_t:CDS:2 [Cetraspora pellucida]